MGLHYALCDGQPQTTALPAISLCRISLDEFIEYLWQRLRWDAWPIVGNGQRYFMGADQRIDDDPRRSRSMNGCIANHIAYDLLNQGCVGFHHWQIGRQSYLDMLFCPAPPSRAGDTIDDFAQIDPVLPQFQGA